MQQTAVLIEQTYFAAAQNRWLLTRCRKQLQQAAFAGAVSTA